MTNHLKNEDRSIGVHISLNKYILRKCQEIFKLGTWNHAQRDVTNETIEV